MPKGDDMTEEKDTSKTTGEQVKSEMVFDDGRIESIQEFQSPEQLYRDLILRVRKYHPSDDISLIEKAYHVAYQAHKDQVRKSGEPYIVHPLCVAIILADLEMDQETIAAGLLHDVVEDTIMTGEEIETGGSSFGRWCYKAAESASVNRSGRQARPAGNAGRESA